MDKTSFYDFLDRPDRLPETAPERELAMLLKELESEEVPDPGTDYWNRFNSRLEQRLEAGRKSRWSWWSPPVWAALALCAAFALFWLIPQREPSLEELSNESLLLISQALAPLDEHPYELDLAESDYDLLLEVLEPIGGGDQTSDTLEGISVEELKLIWNLEG